MWPLRTHMYVRAGRMHSSNSSSSSSMRAGTTTTTTMRSSSSMHAGIEGLCMHACVLLYGPYVYFLPSSKAYFLDALLLGKNGYIVVVVCMHACMCTTVWPMHAVKV